MWYIITIINMCLFHLYLVVFACIYLDLHLLVFTCVYLLFVSFPVYISVYLSIFMSW